MKPCCVLAAPDVVIASTTRLHVLTGHTIMTLNMVILVERKITVMNDGARHPGTIKRDAQMKYTVHVS